MLMVFAYNFIRGNLKFQGIDPVSVSIIFKSLKTVSYNILYIAKFRKHKVLYIYKYITES